MEKVDHPDHYQSQGLQGRECIDLIDEFLLSSGATGIEGFVIGNALKYCFRFKQKGNPSESLRKAAWYLNWLANRLEKE